MKAQWIRRLEHWLPMGAALVLVMALGLASCSSGADRDDTIDDQDLTERSDSTGDLSGDLDASTGDSMPDTLSDVALADAVDAKGETNDLPEVTDQISDLDATDSQSSDVLDLINDLDSLESEVGQDLDSVDAPDETVEPPPEPVPPVPPSLDMWGGLADKHVAEGTGYFTTAEADGRIWFVDPDGNAWFSMGVQALGFGSLPAPDLGYAPGNLAQYSAAYANGIPVSQVSSHVQTKQITTLQEYSFNTVGAWNNGVAGYASGKIAYSISLGFAKGVSSGSVSNPVSTVNKASFPDVFHPDFETACAQYAASTVSETWKSDPWLLGYYLDNELKWWGQEFILPEAGWSLTDDFVALGPETPGKQALVSFYNDRYAGDVAAFNAVYQMGLASFEELLAVTSLPLDPLVQAHSDDRLAFIGLVADKYFLSVNTALKSIDPNHLNMCVRFASIAPLPVVAAMAKHCDVVSINDYYTMDSIISNTILGGTPEERWAKWAATAAEAAGKVKPFLVTEYGIRGKDSGLPNSYGAGLIVDRQSNRAEYYRDTARWFLDRQQSGVGFVVGWHWFMYTDEPPTGRFDGEDSNYGIVTIRGDRYLFTLEGMKSVNEAVLSELGSGVDPTLLPYPTKLQTQVVHDSNGISTAISATWKPVPLAETYVVHVMSHPAGTATRFLATQEVSQPEAFVDVSSFGNGTVWLAVESRNAGLGLLSLGAAVSQPIALAQSEVPGPEDVLACETLATTRWNGSLPMPNKVPGQSYAQLSSTQVVDGQHSIRLEFVTSSLAFELDVFPSTITASILLPQVAELAIGSEMAMNVVPGPVYLASGEMVGSGRFITVQALTADGTVVAESVAPDLLMPEPPALLTLVATAAGQVSELRFVVDIQAPGLPMEQPLVMWVDAIEVTPK